MAVLVTGGAGYIGSHMVHELRTQGRSVIVLDDLSTGEDWLIPSSVPLFRGRCGDVALVSSIMRTFDIDALFHFAGSIIVSESVANPFLYYENNTCQSRTLFETAVQAGGKRIIFSSSAAVYGCPSSVPVAEDATLAPLSPYGSSKLMTEVMLRDIERAYGLRSVCLRYFNVAGADPNRRTGQAGPNATHIIKVAVQAALGIRDGVAIFGDDYPTPDGTCIRDYVHVTDLVKAHMSALEHLEGDGESAALNVGYGHGFSVAEVIEAVQRVSGIPFDVTIKARREGDPPVLVAKSDLSRQLLGWRPRYDDLDCIVQHALTWEKTLARHRELAAAKTQIEVLSAAASWMTAPKTNGATATLGRDA